MLNRLNAKQSYEEFKYECKYWVVWMSAIAFVLINSEIGSEGEVLAELKKVEGVEEAYSVYGVYDVVAKIKAETMDKLKDIITWRIRKLNKVRSTLTMIVIDVLAKTS